MSEVTSPDGTRIWYRVFGCPTGSAPAVVLCDGIACDGFVWKYLGPWLAERFTVLHFNYRGHGRSGLAPDGQSYGIQDNVTDMVGVMDAARVERAVVFGHSMGVQVALEAGLSHPDRVTGLVLLCGSYGRPLDTFRDRGGGHRLLPGLLRLFESAGSLLRPVIRALVPSQLGWIAATLTEVDARLLGREDFQPYLDHAATMDPRVLIRMLQAASVHSTEGRLPHLSAPALVVGGELDRFTPFWVSEVMAQRIPDAELHMLRGGTHAGPLEQRELLELVLEAWLARTGLSGEAPAPAEDPLVAAG